MDFSWSVDQETLYRRVIDETRATLQPRVARRGYDRWFEREEWRLCGEFGLLGLSVPGHYGGLGLDRLTTARLMEAFGVACEDMGLVFAAGAHLFACVMPILEYGSDALKERMLPKLCSGAWIGANAITEAGAGSDVFSLEARAVREGETYVLDGTKTFVTNGPVADVIVVYATVNPAHGFLGITAFAVERETAGVITELPFDKMGLASAPSGVVRLEACRVPATHRLGAEGQGGMVFNQSMQWERLGLFAGFVGMMERQLDVVVGHAAQRRQFRKRIGKYQAVSHRIADMKLRLESARLLLYRGCWLLDQGQGGALDASLAKLAVSEASVRSSLDAIKIFGGAGYMTAAGIERGLRDAVAGTIASGTSEMQRDVIAAGLGL